MLNNLHQIEAETKPFNSTYLDLFLLQDEASIGRVIQETPKQKSSSKCKKVAIMATKPCFPSQTRPLNN